MVAQAAPRTVPYEVYERELERRKQAERTAESQMRTINALQNEVHWLEGTIFNPAFNEVDIRLMAKAIPREIRMGLTGEAPEKKIYLPALGDEALTSEKTASKHLRKLKNMGAVSYRTERDKETGNTRAILGALPAAELPAALKADPASRGGGSTWEDGKRVKRCQTCFSPLLEQRTQTRCTNPACPDCGKILDGEWKSVNHLDIDPDRQSDTESQTPKCPPSTCIHSGGTVGEETTTPDRQSDRRPFAPEKLRLLDQWVVWRYGTERQSNGKLPKLPYDAKAAEARAKYACDYTDPDRWASYDQAVARYQESQSWKGAPYTGIGFVFKEGGGLVGADHDGSLEQLLPSYGERSVSGDGRHDIARGHLPRNIKRDDLGIELYDHDRFFAWTGDHLDDSPIEIRDCQAEIDTLFARIAPPITSAPPPLPAGGTSADEEELAAVLQKASTAANRAKFLKLWGGDASDYRHENGTPDYSSADLALCRMLVFYTKAVVGDPQKTVPTVDTLFRRSKLMRDKWDRTARAGETYGQGTIRRALSALEVVR